MFAKVKKIKAAPMRAAEYRMSGGERGKRTGRPEGGPHKAKSDTRGFLK